MTLHPVFQNFPAYQGPSRPGLTLFDFLGLFVRREYVDSEGTPEPPSFLSTEYPGVTEDLFAWIDLLEAVVSAPDCACVVELGAGYGAWMTRAAIAARQLGKPCRLVGVEAEPVHFRWLGDTLRDNDVDVSQHRLIQAAVSDTAGKTWFYVDSPWMDRCTPNRWYGQLIAQENDTVESVTGDSYEGHPVVRFKSGFKGIEVPLITLDTVLEGLDVVDLVHIDVQGAELAVCRGGIDVLNRKVKRLNIGTHYPEVEVGLRDLLKSHQWTCLHDYPVQARSMTPYGEIDFGDGVQTWTNPRL